MTQKDASTRGPFFSMRGMLFCCVFVSCLTVASSLVGQTNAPTAPKNENRLVMTQGLVEIARAGTDSWKPGRANQVLFSGDRVRTGERSRAEVFLSSGMTVTKGEFSEIEIPPSQAPTFKKGLFKILSRERDQRSEFKLLPGTTAAIRGTDFLVRVTENGVAELTVLDGEVLLRNSAGEVLVRSNERGIVEGDAMPRKTAVIETASDLIQWSLYYPAVVNVDELSFTLEEGRRLARSLDAYRAGDLLAAGAAYPWDLPATSPAARVYEAALLLSVGKVEAAGEILAASTAESAADALSTLIAATKFIERADRAEPLTASEWLAESYYQQSRYRESPHQLERALNAARAAATNAPHFGFAWARVAELEFSFGHASAAQAALERALRLSPRNAAAIALNGFVLAAQNKIPAALAEFDRAIAQDSALANAWLGRGLCRFRRGDAAEGLRDLMIAASLESQRSVLRSYLGKAFIEVGDIPHATHELALARKLDPGDPTGWLYSALLNQQENRINQAVADLERSQEFNENRRLYRSQFLLDQDRAVRSANLAAIYRDAGMFDVSAREASRAVISDYANYSAHLFLANSYNELRDPSLASLRYETAVVSEYLLANLLSPVGASPLSPQVSQQEYSRLFERDHVGLISHTAYTSNGDWEQDAAQFGTLGNTAYALGGSYRSFNGQYRNNDLRQFAFAAQVKQQITPQDSLYVQAIYSDLESGDVRQYYDPRFSSPDQRVKERQEPNVFAGYHHEWSPGIHTLLLAGRLDDTFTLTEPNAIIPTFVKDSQGQITAVVPDFGRFDIDFKSVFDAYTAELQQIVQVANHTVIVGARFQTGETETHSDTSRDPFTFPPVYDPLYRQRNTTDLERLNMYLYDNWRVCNWLWLSAGISYDRVKFPENVDSPPISDRHSEKERGSPKAGFIWMPDDATSIRGAYTRSLGGLFYDQSVRLEPTQIAGFNQAFRSLIPESVVGPVSGSEFETFHLGADRHFPSRTYIVLDAAILKSRAQRTLGVFDYVDVFPFPNAVPSQTRANLDYEEHSLTVAVNQLVGDCWSFGARYRVSESDLTTRLPQIPDNVTPDTHERAVLHQLDLFAIYNLPCGFFARAEAVWWAQDNHGYSPALRDDDFWHFNVVAGYRFFGRRAEVALGILNLSDQDYRLNPLSPYGQLPRDRTLVTSLTLTF